MSNNQIITNRSGVHEYTSFASFPTTGERRFLYLDQSDGSCYDWDDIGAKYRPVLGGIKRWKPSTRYSIGEPVIADFAIFISTTDHVSSSTGTLYDDTGRWRNVTNNGKLDVINVTGSAIVTVSELNPSDFNLLIQPDNTTSNLIITLPNPSERIGQVLTYCFSAVPSVTTTATVAFINLDGSVYGYTPTFKIPNATNNHQGIKTLRFVNTARFNGDTTATWFPIDEDFRGATTSLAGTNGYVPAPTVADVNKFLSARGIWDIVNPTLSVWTTNTAYSAGRLFNVDSSVFLVTSDTTSGTGTFVADLLAGKPYSWVGGNEYTIPLPTVPGTINVNVPGLRILSGTVAGNYTLPVPTGSGRRYRITRDDLTTNNIGIVDPASGVVYSIPYSATRQTDVILVDMASVGWTLDGWTNAPRAVCDITFASSTAVPIQYKNMMIRIDSTVSSINLTLPSSGMQLGDFFKFVDLHGKWNINPLQVTGRIYGSDDTYAIDLAKQVVTFTYIDSTTGYVLD